MEVPLCALVFVSFRVDVVICLSTTVRNDTLQDAKEQRVSVKCRKQLRVEEVEMVRSLTRSQSEVRSGFGFQRDRKSEKINTL